MRLAIEGVESPGGLGRGWGHREERLAKAHAAHGYTREEMATFLGIPDERGVDDLDDITFDEKERQTDLLIAVAKYTGLSLEVIEQLFWPKRRDLKIEKLAIFILCFAAADDEGEQIICLSQNGRNVDPEGYVRSFETKQHDRYVEPDPEEIADAVDQIDLYLSQPEEYPIPDDLLANWWMCVAVNDSRNLEDYYSGS